jgi:alkanesulfonate monooxygenase SsuD/methylene tetrahydromethanopterin reductase-like flavin-dependent oxidoreductase (luciferase family)
MNKLDFYFFHLMPYPFIPPGDEIESTWVTLPNSLYDPKVGHRLYNEYLEQSIAAERFGFDGTIVNEHHQNAYGTMPSPNIMASYIAARTERIPIGIIGNALPLHANPVRVAEEVAMLDVISGGRIISGFVRGTGMEYYSYASNPSYSQERFWEAHDLIIKAWTETGPFAWEGKHWNLPFVNPWPRPMQRPHPPVWLPGTGSLETIDRAAERRYPFMMVFAPQWFTKAAYDMYHRAAEKYGYEASPKQLAATVPTYVAETDEQAHREAKAHVMWLFQNGLRIPSYQWFPPGYMTKRSFQNMRSAQIRHNMKERWHISYEELLEERYVIVGSPDTVIERLTEITDTLGAGIVIGAGGHFGTMPNWMVLKNMQIMAEDVMPAFREPGGKPTWAKEDRLGPHTIAENAAQVGRPQPRPLARVDGRMVDTQLAHLGEAAVVEEREPAPAGD